MYPGESQSEAPRKLNDLVRAAFDSVREGYSPDRVVVDPDLNARFLRECRQLGAAESDAELNRCLLNVRKKGNVPGLRSRRTVFTDRAEYAFAAEIAVRFLERRDNVTLDDIICDPAMVGEFDRIAGSIAPGFTQLQFRWAALYLRKTRRLRPEPIGRAIPPASVAQQRADELDLNTVPPTQGLYAFFSRSEWLYVGETENLRGRLRKHLDHSDNRGLARWLWEHETGPVFVEWQELPRNTPPKTRRAMEHELIQSRRPLFNVMYAAGRRPGPRGGARP